MRKTKKWCSALTATMLALTLWPAPSALAANDQKSEPPTPPSQQEQPVGTEEASAPDELIIKYKEGSDLTKVAGKNKGKIEKVGKQIGKLKAGIVKLPKGSNKKALIEELKADPEIEYVQPNYAYQAQSAPNDPYYGEQWHLQRIKADQAWQTTTGSPSVPVAVIDTGVKSSDPDLKANLLPGYNAIDGSTNTEDDSSNAHGTKVAGVIAATQNNNYQISGVAPTSKILPVKALAANGRGYDIDIAEAIMWATDHGAKVINLSFGTPYWSMLVEEAIVYAKLHGAVVVTTSGSDNGTASYPRNDFPGRLDDLVLAVGATDNNNALAPFSYQSNHVDLVAPGVNIRTTDGNSVNGTSFATAQVSAAAALVRSNQPQLTPNQVMTILQQTTKYIGPYTNSEWRSDLFGYGLLDVHAALQSVADTKSDLILLGDGPDRFVPGRENYRVLFYIWGEMYSASLNIYNSANKLVVSVGGAKSVGGDIVVTRHAITWNGKDFDGKFVPKGTYTYTLQTHLGEDAGGLSTPLKGTIIVEDAATPAVQNVAVGPNPFVANGSNMTTLSYSLTKESKVTTVIYNGSTPVRTLTDRITQSTGSHEIEWDGRNDQGQLLPSAEYRYEIKAEDLTGVAAPNVTGALTLTRDTTHPAISNLSDAPERVSDKSTISFTLSSPGTIGVEIFDQESKRVRTLSQQQLPSGNNQITWDGTNDAGAPLPDQDYSYKVFSVDTTGAARNEVWGTITLDKSKPVIRNITLNTNQLVVADSNNVTFDYELSENADSTVTVTNSTGVKVATLNSSRLSATKRSAAWTGRDSSNVALPSGVYTYTITATDQNGMSATPMTGSIQLTNSLLSDVNVVYESSNDLARVYYTLAEPATVNIDFYDKNGLLVRNLVTDLSQASGSHSRALGLTTANNEAILDGVYTAKVTAKTSSGKTEELRSSFLKDSVAPLILNPKVTSHYFDPIKRTPIKLTYSSSEDGYTSAFIATGWGMKGPKKSLIANKPVKAGELVEVTWDGTDGLGNPLPDGDYYFFLMTVEQPATYYYHNAVPVYIGSRPDTISNISDGPDPFKATGTSQNIINYTIKYAGAFVTLELFDSQGNRVRTLFNNVDHRVNPYSVAWNGKNDAGALVADGTYTYKFSGTDLDGTPLEPVVGGTITVDKSLPTISNIKASPNPFTPLRDLYTTINYTLAEDSKVTVNIYNSTGTLVKTIISEEFNNAGYNNSVTWDGKNTSGVSVPDGLYTYKITSTDIVGFSTTATGTLQVGNAQTPAFLYAGSNTQTLKLTGTTAATIYYEVNQAANVTAKVYNSSNVLVRTLLSNAPTTKGGKAVAWNGTNDAGALVDDGVYTYKFSAVNSAGQAAPQVSGTIRTDKNAPVLSSLSTTPSSFAPTGTNSMSIKYTLNEEAKVTVGIYNTSGALVRTLATTVQNYAGVNSVNWDGKDSQGAVVPMGTYSYRILATDQVGLSRNTTGSFKVAKPPVISNVSDTSDPLKVTGTTASTIYYTLSEASNVTVRVYSSNNSLVRTLLSNSPQTAGTKPVAWNGKNDAGALVADGVYTYKINAVNAAGLAAVEVKGTITTDKTAPTLVRVAATPNPFNPLLQGTMNFELQMNEQIKAALSIYNSSGVLVKTIATTDLDPLPRLTWDGTDNSGRPVPNGAYSYRIVATDWVGLSRVVSGVFKVDAQAQVIPPVISAVSDGPDPLKVTGTTSSTIYYTLSKPARVTIKVYDSTDRLIRTLLSDSPQTAGAKPAAWNGKDDADLLVADGTYTYKISAVDDTGTAAALMSGTITTDKTAPLVTNITATPNPFAPLRDTTMSIKFDLNEDAKVTIGIYNTSAALVKTVSSAVLKKAGSNSVTWDGKDTAGLAVPNGAYSYRILATDLAGLSRSASGVFKVEN